MCMKKRKENVQKSRPNSKTRRHTLADIVSQGMYLHTIQIISSVKS